jgi:hypothetical protein
MCRVEFRVCTCLSEPNPLTYYLFVYWVATFLVCCYPAVISCHEIWLLPPPLSLNLPIHFLCCGTERVVLPKGFSICLFAKCLDTGDFQCGCGMFQELCFALTINHLRWSWNPGISPCFQIQITGLCYKTMTKKMQISISDHCMRYTFEVQHLPGSNLCRSDLDFVGTCQCCGLQEKMEGFVRKIVNLMKANELFAWQGGPIILAQVFLPRHLVSLWFMLLLFVVRMWWYLVFRLSSCVSQTVSLCRGLHLSGNSRYLYGNSTIVLTKYRPNTSQNLIAKL